MERWSALFQAIAGANMSEQAGGDRLQATGKGDVETFLADLRAAGLEAWDRVDDPAEFLRELRGGEQPKPVVSDASVNLLCAMLEVRQALEQGVPVRGSLADIGLRLLLALGGHQLELADSVRAMANRLETGGTRNPPAYGLPPAV